MTENDKILQKMFEIVNQKHFNNELPPIKLEWNNNKSRAGFFQAQRVGDKRVPLRISISYPYFIDRKNNDRIQEMIETMLEECVHYWQCLNNKGFGHNSWYYYKMAQVGCPVTPQTRFCESLENGKNWKYTCVNESCGQVYTKVKRLKNEKNRLCGVCHSKLKVDYIGDE